LVRRAYRAAGRFGRQLGLRNIRENRRILNERIRTFVFSRCRPAPEGQAA
jgi:hypothetical protein